MKGEASGYPVCPTCETGHRAKPIGQRTPRIQLGERSMKHLSSTLWLLSAVVLLCGCGGGTKTSGPPPGPPSDPPAQGQNISGNWQFNTTSTAEMSPATIAGSITQSGVSVSGAVHVDGSNCFEHLTTIGLTGTLTGSDISLTSTSVNGQITTFTGTISDDALNGTDSAFTGVPSVDIEIKTDNGTVTFLGTLNRDRSEISGNYTVSGGTCDQTGTSVLSVSSPWDY